MADHLFDGYGGTFTTQTSTFGTEIFGTPIAFARGGTVTGVRFYRPDTTFETPAAISLWRKTGASSATLIESFGLAPLGANTGWFEYSLSTPEDVAVGDVLIPALSWTTTHHKSYLSGAFAQPWTLYQRLDPAGWVSTVGLTGSTSLSTFIKDDFAILPIDCAFEPVPFGDFTLSELTDELQRWLTAGGDKYPDSIFPERATVQNDTYNEVAHPDHGLSAIMASLTAGLETWTDGLAVKLGTALGADGRTLDQIYDGVENGRTEFAAGFADVLEGIGEYTGTSILAYAAELIRWANGVNAPPQLAEGDDWELLDETDFTNNLLWPVEADLYRVTLSSFDPAGTSEPVGAETRHAFLGKWCPFNVQFSSEWHYFNTPSADLYLRGRMPGLGLILYRPGTGHVQAWRRKDAA